MHNAFACHPSQDGPKRHTRFVLFCFVLQEGPPLGTAHIASPLPPQPPAVTLHQQPLAANVSDFPSSSGRPLSQCLVLWPSGTKARKFYERFTTVATTFSPVG